MYKKKRVIAIVTARGGSKGLPGKNIRNLNGKPLIVWTLEKAKMSKYLDRIFVSTDSPEIADICEKNDVAVPELRPGELARDDTSSMDVLKYTVLYLEEQGDIFDYLILLEPTSPLRRDEDIDRMIELAVNDPDADGVISLGCVHLEHPTIVKRISKNGYIIPYADNLTYAYQRQMEDAAFFPYGVGYLVKVDRFMTTHSIYMDKMLPYYIERWQNYEIDDIYDFNIIERIMEMEGIK